MLLPRGHVQGVLLPHLVQRLARDAPHLYARPLSRDGRRVGIPQLG